MRLTRIIHPIGQGGFYTETLRKGDEEINIVYDCGGFGHNKTMMENYLKNYYSKNQNKNKIEAVFISHFHIDHINGLHYLLNHAEVKFLILPQLTDDLMFESFVYNYCTTNSYNRTNSLLMKLYSNKSSYDSEKGSTKIIHVETINDYHIPAELNTEELANNDLTLKILDFNQNQSVNLMDYQSKNINILSGAVLHSGEWVYIPFNPIVSLWEKNTLRKKLCDYLGTNIGVVDLPNLKEIIRVEDCRRIYKEVFGNKHNSYSMTLFSGLSNWKKNHHQCRMPCKCSKSRYFCNNLFWHPYYNNPNFLYTGDFEPKRNMSAIKNFYLNYWKRIASIQVPHHGSKNNYDDNLYKNPIRGIISVGSNNTYHHPSIYTLVKLQNQHCHPIIVTEDKDSKKIFQYNIS